MSQTSANATVRGPSPLWQNWFTSALIGDSVGFHDRGFKGTVSFFFVVLREFCFVCLGTDIYWEDLVTARVCRLVSRPAILTSAKMGDRWLQNNGSQPWLHIWGALKNKQTNNAQATAKQLNPDLWGWEDWATGLF